MDGDLLVDGDPFDVLLDLLSQAESSRLTTGTLNNHGLACEVRGQTLLECDLSMASESPPRTYSFTLRWGNDRGADYRHVLVSQSPTTYGPAPEVEDLRTDPPQIPEIDLPPAPQETADWRPPEVGEPVAGPPSALPDAAVERASGASVIAPAGPATCITGGYTTVMRVDDDADVGEIVNRYTEQFEDRGFDGETTMGIFEERPYTAAWYHTAGGGELEAVAIDINSENPLLLLRRCND